MNVLASDPDVRAQPSGGTPAAAAAVLAGSTASEVVVGAGAVGTFSVGDIIAVDADYAEQVGYVGTGISAAYVSDPVAVKRDANYVRRVTFNLGRVVEMTATTVVLGQPLLGGAPAAGDRRQEVVAFVDREGGAFFQEWSALFVAEEESGGRMCFYYPRLSPNPGQGSNGFSWDVAASSGTRKSASRAAGKALKNISKGFVREELTAIGNPLSAISLRASFLALPSSDPNDGQIVLCYRSYFPASLAEAY